jgi:undecaprenyl diphosphate synthase
VLGQDLVYRVYARQLRKQLIGCPLPKHVGLIMDGNRRWARQRGFADPSLGHKYGADHIDDVLNWCAKAGIKHVTAFLCSTENLSKRSLDGRRLPTSAFSVFTAIRACDAFSRRHRVARSVRGQLG